MTIRTPIDKQHIRVHMTYHGWKYIVLVIASIVGWSLLYTTTAYRSPQDKRIDVYLRSSTVDTEMANAFLKPLWDEVVPDMEVVDAVALIPGDDYSAVMQLQVYMASGEGDIYFLSAEDFKSYAAAEALVSLDDYIANGTINVDGLDISSGLVKVIDEYTVENEPVYTGEEHIYGIPTDELFGFMNGFQLDNRGMVMCISINNQNDENVVPFFNALLQAGRGEKPEWLLDEE